MNLLITVTTDKYKSIAEVTHPSMQAYAEKINAKFLVILRHDIDKCDDLTNGHFNILRDLSEYDYERAIFLHTDILIRPDTPSLFNVVPQGWVGSYFLGHHITPPDLNTFAANHNLEKSKPWGDRWYSYGVVVADKSHMDKLITWDETYFNYCLNQFVDHNHILDIGPRFNCMPYFDSFSPYYSHLEYYMIHYSQLLQQVGAEQLKQIIEGDISTWQKLKYNDYHIPKTVLVRVGGGLGDQICAEPVIREIRRLHPKDRLVVESSWPELWDNLKGYSIDDTVLDPSELMMSGQKVIAYYTYKDFNTSIQQLGMTHSNMSSTDLTSYLALTRPLPPEKRSIHINFTEEECNSMLQKIGRNLCWPTTDWIKSAIVLHPGLTWPTRTLDPNVWKELIAKLLKDNHHVIVIGQGGQYRGPRSCETIGILDFDFEENENFVDARNLLSVKETLALLSHAFILVSNDSAPIHLAGATDIWILGMFTTKHPYFVFPFRNGTPWHKAVPINLTPECWPCGVNAVRAFPEGLRVDLCKNYETPYCCHPKADQIYYTVKEIEDGEESSSVMKEVSELVQENRKIIAAMNRDHRT